MRSRRSEFRATDQTCLSGASKAERRWCLPAIKLANTGPSRSPPLMVGTLQALEAIPRLTVVPPGRAGSPQNALRDLPRYSYVVLMRLSYCT
jgi:hypothetical protein